MSIKKTQVEAANTDRALILAAAPGRKKAYLYNDTSKTFYLSLGEDGEDSAELPTIDDDPDLTFKSLPIGSGVLFEVTDFFEEALSGFWEEADAGKFLRITEVF